LNASASMTAAVSLRKAPRPADVAGRRAVFAELPPPAKPWWSMPWWVASEARLQIAAPASSPAPMAAALDVERLEEDAERWDGLS